VAAISIFGWWMSLPPKALPADAPATEFSAERALEHIRATCQVAHPAGSHENEAVLQYIVDTLRGMNVEMTLERRVTSRGHRVDGDTIVLARIPGSNSTGAFAVDAHYDSTPYGPGAADDMSGIAAMLETIRALQAGDPLMNDIIFCFVDREEMGGGGPETFTAHPWYQDVRAVLGLEARGTAGPALMFETAPDNGFLIRQMAQSDAHPRATSIMFDVYDRMPFGSDFTHYKHSGTPGLNVAYIDEFCNYHTKLDNPENVNLDSLQHHGQYTLGLARQLGSVSLENVAAPDASYFNTVGSHMVVYPRTWGWPLAGIVLSVLALVLIAGLVRGQLNIGGMIAGMSVYLLSVVLCAVLMAPLSVLTYYLYQEHTLYRNNMLAMGLCTFGLGIFALVALLVRDRARPQNLLAGILLCWAIVLVLLQLYLPGGAYAATWPLLFLSIGLLVLIFGPKAFAPTPKALALATLALVPALLMLPPTFVMFSYTLTALATPLLMVIVLLLVGTLLPQMTLLSRRQHLLSGTAMVLLGLGLFLAGMFTNTPSAERPRQNCLAYAVNFDTGESWWLSGNAAPDAWTSNFFDASSPRVGIADFLGHDDGYTYLQAPAPAAPFEALKLNVLEDVTENGRRKLRLHVDSPRDAQEIQLILQSEVEVFSAKAFGHDIEPKRKEWRLHLQTIPFEGGELVLEVEAGKPLRFLAREVSFKFPEGLEHPPRPDWMMTQTNRRLDRSQDLRSSHTYSIATIEL
jgi:hypothetical protein